MIGESKGRGISLLVPRSPGVDAGRDRLWDWLQRYWRAHLPLARIVEGRDPEHLSRPGRTFSKTTAVNDAARRAKGDILVILDSDAYVAPEIIVEAAHEIRRARKRGRRLWFIPYRRFYRLGPDLTEQILASDPWLPQNLGDPLAPELRDPVHGNAPEYGHHYAAMIMVFPQEAFKEVGGMDERFIGWGGEDISFMRAMDTVYNTHKTIDHAVYHLYHHTFGVGVNRQWIGQVKRMPFTILGARYQAAYGDPARMLRLNNEWRNGMMKVHPNIDANSILNPDVIPEAPVDHDTLVVPLPIEPERVDIVPLVEAKMPDTEE